ncbi:glycoside hydrolase family 2 TIM barrel-domain containing protein [Pontiella desulfatans]|nr:glycoside hydrolase family 2 TIM barrel-domain containing protein [Pontiella desulfatans]
MAGVDVESVKVSGRRILVDDTPYVIKGICYHPVPKGSRERNFGRLSEDLGLMKEAGINTIRAYSPIDSKAVLDEIYASGLKIIIGFEYNRDILSGSFIDYVNTYKNHPAILMWEMGNEYNYHPEWFDDGDIRVWYEALNNAAVLIHQNDASHPVATAHGELPDELALSTCPDVDVWGMNIYRWDNPEDLFAEWAAISSKPMYLSEAGADSYMNIAAHGYGQGENQKAQADATRNILAAVFEEQDVCSGVALFSFLDGWWKADDPSTHDPHGSPPVSSGVPYDGVADEEYWGIVDIDRNKKLAFDVVKDWYHALRQD